MPQAQQQSFSDVQPLAQSFTNVEQVSDGKSSDNAAADTGYWAGVKSALKSAAPDVSSFVNFLKSEVGAGKMFIPALIGESATEAATEGIRRASREMAPDKGAGYRVANAISPLVPGLNPESMEARAEKGDTSGILGEASVPLAAVVAGPVAKEIVPSADTIRSGWRKIGNPFGLASTGEELLTQGISPRTSLTKFGPSLEKAAGDLKSFDAQSPIKNVHDLNDAIPEIKQKIWSEEVEPALQRQATKTVDMKPVADKVRAQISDEMRTFDEANAEKLDKLADKLETAKDVKGANSLLKYINGQLESYFQKFPAARRANLMNNPETAGWEAARSELRNQFLNTLEIAGETGVRDARLRYGAFDTLQDAVERRVNVADRAKPMSLGRIVGLAGAAPTGGLSLVAGELSNYLNKPDVLIRRGIKNLPESIRKTPFAPATTANPLVTPGNVSPITRGPLASPAQLFTSAGEKSAFNAAVNEETLASIEQKLKRVGISDEERGILERQRDDYKAMGGK